MCLITNQQKPLIAEEDIHVFKELSPKATSVFYRFKYELNVLYETTFGEGDFTPFDHKDRFVIMEKFGWTWELDDSLICIGQGFHSFLKEERCKTYDDGKVIYEAIIPKGAEYYIGFSDLAVSNKIIITNILTN